MVQKVPAPGPKKPVLVIVGMAREESIAAGPGVVTVVSASDPARLRALLAGLQGSDYRTVVSFGIAGGLDPAFPSGQVMIARSVVAASGATGAWTTDPGLVTTLDTLLRSGGIATRTGVIAGADTLTLANGAALKAALRASSGADEVDMESHLAAAFAAANGLPFVALRAVSDTASHGLPPAALLPLLPDGSVDYAAIVGSVGSNPSQIGPLLQAFAESETAFAALSSCRQAVDLGSLP